MLFEIFADEQTAEPRVIKGREGKPDRHVYDQHVYWIKGRQLIQLTVTSDSLPECYPAGRYTIHEDSFEAENAYGRGQLKFNPYRFKLAPLSAQKADERSKAV
ncbi:single-stranded DNA-binding protein [Shewanella algae]|uniref:single-stranded DNA-binding protein n=1 Tax=Shewanella algae TaxID=38313 RepID=UPI0031F4B445